MGDDARSCLPVLSADAGMRRRGAGRWLEACRTLHTLLLGEAEHDRPTLTLLSRATKALQEPPEPFDPVIDLGHK